MKNQTTVRVPNKYQHMIAAIYRGLAGVYICELNEGYISETFDGAEIMCRTQNELMREIRLIKKVS